MTPDQEKSLLEAIYDRLFDVITYQPVNGKNPFMASETFIHFSKNAALNVKAFANPRTPSNPLGDLKASEEFSRMVDQISPLSLEWENSSTSLSRMYEDILRSANTDTKIDSKAMALYTKAFNYLHPERIEKNPFTEEETKIRTDCDDLVNYEINMADYVTAIMKYRMAYNLYWDNLQAKKENADRNWQVNAPVLENAIKQSFRKLNAGNSKYVEQAFAVLGSTINDGIRQAIESAKSSIADDRKFSSSLGFSENWLLSYPSPSDWTNENNVNYTDLKISGSNTKVRSTSTKQTFDIESKLNFGLWKVQANSGGSFEHSNSSMDKDSIEISAKIAKVNIMRPWFTESLFRLGDWYTSLAKKAGISNGLMDSSNAQSLLPMYPVSFIVAKDIRIKADFSHEDEEHIRNSAHAGASVGFGPFSIGGSYGYGKTEDKFNADLQNGELIIPGFQIIGWVSRLLPLSPKMDVK
jgi:hypothetical protein